MNFEGDQLLRKELAPGERLLWSGIPRQGIKLRSSDLLAVPFSLMWGGFTLFWEYSVIHGGAPIFFAAWGIPFVLLGIYVMVGRFFVDSRVRSRTFYGLTDQRVIISSGLINRDVKSLSLRTLSEISVQERSDRSGTITFGPANRQYDIWGGSWPGASRKMTPAFDFIEEVRKVYDLVRDAQRRAFAAD